MLLKNGYVIILFFLNYEDLAGQFFQNRESKIGNVKGGSE